MLPPVLDALALSVIVAGAWYELPPAGDVRLTIGGPGVGAGAGAGADGAAATVIETAAERVDAPALSVATADNE